jgi:4-carboxymuconolactone decarboxylase
MNGQGAGTTAVRQQSVSAAIGCTRIGDSVPDPEEIPMSSERLPLLKPEQMSEAQRKAADEFAEGRGYAVRGPFAALLRSPEVMLRAKAMGDYLRYKSSIPAKLNELAICLTARHWGQSYEWHAHAPLAIKAGLDPEIAKAVSEGRRPAKLDADEAIVVDFCTELHHNKCVSDATYARALARFGEQGVIDLTAVNGYYTLIAMVLNVARTALPEGATPQVRPFPN